MLKRHGMTNLKSASHGSVQLSTEDTFKLTDSFRVEEVDEGNKNVKAKHLKDNVVSIENLLKEPEAIRGTESLSMQGGSFFVLRFFLSILQYSYSTLCSSSQSSIGCVGLTVITAIPLR